MGIVKSTGSINRIGKSGSTVKIFLVLYLIVLCLQETKTQQNKIINLPLFSCTVPYL